MTIHTQRVLMFIPLANLIVPVAWFANSKNRKHFNYHLIKCILIVILAIVSMILLYSLVTIPFTILRKIVNYAFCYLLVVVMDAILISDQKSIKKSRSKQKK